MMASLMSAVLGGLTGVLLKLISRELFESVAEKALIHLLTWEKDRTENTLDDAIVAEVVAALKGKP